MRNRGLLARLALILSVTSLGLAGCVANLGTGWAGLAVLGGGTEIAYAYENTLSVVDVVTGEPLMLLDADGRPRLADNGEPLQWQINGNDLDNAKFFADPLVYDNKTLLVATLDRRLVQFDLETADATEISEQIEARGNAVTGLVGVDGSVFVGLQQGLVALDRESLGLAWQFETQHGVWSEALVVDETAYFTSLDHFMYAVDVDSGETVWSLDLGGAATATPAYSEALDAFFIGTFDSKMLKVSREGDLLDEYATDGWVWGAPTLVEGMLYFSDLNGYVYKLDPETLTEAGGWRSEVAEGAIRTPPTVFEDYVVVGSRDQSVYWLDRDSGNEIFNRMLDGEVLSDILYFPANADDGIDEALIVVSTLSNRESLVAFGAATGERIWTYRR